MSLPKRDHWIFAGEEDYGKIGKGSKGGRALSREIEFGLQGAQLLQTHLRGRDAWCVPEESGFRGKEAGVLQGGPRTYASMSRHFTERPVRCCYCWCCCSWHCYYCHLLLILLEF